MRKYLRLVRNRSLTVAAQIRLLSRERKQADMQFFMTLRLARALARLADGAGFPRQCWLRRSKRIARARRGRWRNFRLR
jgi:hypothetical protein